MITEGNVKDYIVKTLGLSCEVKNSFRVNLPFYLKSRFDILMMNIEEEDFLLLKPNMELQLTNSAICSSAENIRKQTGYRTIIVLENLDSEARRMLIAKKECFIVPQKQMYVPMLGLIFQERGLLTGNEKNSETFSPATQRLVLYHLQIQSLNGKSLNCIAELLGYPAKTITQIAKELKNKNLCEIVSQSSRSKAIQFVNEGKALWDKAFQYMQNPIKYVWYVDDMSVLDEIAPIYTYDQALGHYTFMADSGKQSMAVYWRSEQIKDVDFRKYEGTCRVELWKYPPIIIDGSNYVDPLSLALCYKDEHDERVDYEIHKLIDKTLGL